MKINAVVTQVPLIIEKRILPGGEFEFKGRRESAMFAEDYKLWEYDFNQMEIGETIDTWTVSVEELGENNWDIKE